MDAIEPAEPINIIELIQIDRRTRAWALHEARDILVTSGPLFGGSNLGHFTVNDLLSVAHYILYGVPDGEPEQG